MKIQPKLILALAIGIAAAGCDTGEAPKGLSPAETEAAVNALPPEKQIEYINRSPMPAAAKEKKIAEIKAKAGMK